MLLNFSNNEELVGLIRNNESLTKKDTEIALHAVLNLLTELLAKGSSIVLIGLANLSVKKLAAHKGCNPATGKLSIFLQVMQ